MHEVKNWTFILVTATVAVTLAAAGLLGTTLLPGASPLLATALLGASLAATGASFTLVALRLRKLELENEGLIEEISQEFDRVKDKLEIYGEALQEPRSISPEAPTQQGANARRVMVK